MDSISTFSTATPTTAEREDFAIDQEMHNTVRRPIARHR